MNILCYSYGKDSGACIHVMMDILHKPIDRIVTADIWATETVPAVLPEVWEWQQKADELIKSRYGLTVEHYHAIGADGEKETYEKIFYRTAHNRPEGSNTAYGFPKRMGPWCNSKLKVCVMETITKQASKSGATNIVGIAYDEPVRIERMRKRDNVVLPLVEAQWTEAMCYEWCKDNGLLSPTYETGMRDGCWFCHNQGVDQLRMLRANHPELWNMLLVWDNDSVGKFKQDGQSVHDYEKRFAMEDEGIVNRNKRWFWDMLNKNNGGNENEQGN